MPISGSAKSLEKSKHLQSKDNFLNNKRAPTEGSYLTIERALPVVETAKKLYQRSNSTLGTSTSKTNVSTHTSENVALHSHPDGYIHIARTTQEKEIHPDRICLDRRGLTAFPILENETNLRLLSLQHNLISNLETFRRQGFPCLVFLDLYDNQLEKIHCLDELQNLRVLLIGKNRIKRIEGLENLTKIEVLDLHGNQILHISGLSTLNQLKVLNLAGNQLRNIGNADLKGLVSLQEFNLRRNRLKKLLGFGETPNLQKLYLNNNELQSVEDMSSLAKATNIREIAVDNNPISLGGDCVSFLVSYLPHLNSLNNINITEQVRKAAMAWRRNKENSNTVFMDLTSDVSLNVRREEVISNARTNWELLRSQTKCLTNNSSNAVNVSKNLKPDNDFILTSLVKPDAKHFTSRPKSSIVSSVSSVPTLPNKRLSVRTMSQDTENSQNTSSSNASSNEFFRLPPILLPIINKMEQKDNGSVNLSGSLSSIEPNIDSSVSSLLSNSESSESSCDINDSCSENEQEENVLEQQVPIVSNVCIKKVEVPDEHGYAANIQNPEILIANSSTSSTKLRLEHIASTSSTSKTSNASFSNQDNKTLLKKVRPIKSAAFNQKPNNTKLRNRPITSKSRKDNNNHSDHCIERDREQGGDYLIELCGKNLNVYGQGALRFIDKSWSITKAKEVVTVNFNYVNFNSLTAVFNKLKNRFPNVENFVFEETNILYLGQINALAEIQGLTSLTINKDGNPITNKKWESYAIYRLAHWGLKYINGREISEENIQEANAEFQSLSDLVLWSLPDALLQPLLVRLQLNVNQKINEQNAKKWLFSADPALRIVVVKEALQWKKGSLTQEDILLRQRAKTYLSSILDEAFHAVYKLRRLEKEWPKMFREVTSNILLDYTHLDLYMKKQLQELK